MELVYLWIEKYKNIERQGFTFSPRFKCEFKPKYNEKDELIPKESELVIEEKKDYVNIFPDNINVTAIVGKNGAGKSSLLHLLIASFYNNHNNWREIKSSIIVFKKGLSFIIYHLYKNSQKNIKVKIKQNNKYFIKNSLDEDLKKTYYLLIDFSISQPNIYNSNNNYKLYYSIEPSRFYKTSGGGSIYSKIEPSSFDSNLKGNLIYFYWYIFKNDLTNILKEFNLPILKKLICNTKKRIGKPVKDQYFNNLKKNKAKILNYDFEKIENYDQIQCFDKLIDIEDLNENDFNYIEDLLIFLDMELIDEDNDFYFFKMSTGQQYLLSYFGILLRYYVTKYQNDNDFKNAIVLIDEVESALHPEWQKNFLYYILNFIKKLKLNNFFNQIIISTHSPFILSDIPKENIIFMKDGKNVSDEVEIETFGANIHTLLTHGFFMEDGLMGEYARSKIDEVIKYSNNEESEIKSNEEAQRIINIIGEPIIKKELQRRLDSKKLDNIEKIEEEIRLLKERLEILRKNY